MSKASSLPFCHWRLAQLASHLVVALIALVVVGGATRVMEAGLACPDWPLCFGSFLPGHQMNLQVFLEWFHRLDAFVIGIALLVQLWLAVIWRSHLPAWLPWIYALLVFLVLFQGALGAMTVLQLLPSGVVTAHLALALTLVAIMSALAQKLLVPNGLASPAWWRWMCITSLACVMSQCLLGGRMATTWAAQRCLIHGQACQWLFWHRFSAIPVAFSVFILVITSFLVKGWPRSQWPFLLTISTLLMMQVCLGFLSVNLGLSQPTLTIGHQLIAALLVAFLSAMSCRSPQGSTSNLLLLKDQPLLEACHG